MKKQKPTWYIAIIHYVISGLVIPYLISILLLIPVLIVIGKDKTTEASIAAIIIFLFSLYPSVVWSSRYILNRYVITDSNSICNLAAIYLIIFEVVKKSYTLFTVGISATYLIGVGAVIAMFIVYYLLNKKYICNN